MQNKFTWTGGILHEKMIELKNIFSKEACHAIAQAVELADGKSGDEGLLRAAGERGGGLPVAGDQTKQAL